MNMTSESIFVCTANVSGQRFYSEARLVQHLKDNIRKGYEICCPVSGCLRNYIVVSSFSSHLSRCHNDKPSYGETSNGLHVENDAREDSANFISTSALYSGGLFTGDSAELTAVASTEKIIKQYAMFF